MSVIAVTSSRTSPGATSLATGLALALSAEYDRALLIEADASGGVLSLRFDLDVTPSLTTFGSDTRNGYSHDIVWKNTQDLRGVHCMPGPVDPRLARSWVERVTPGLVEHLPTLGAPAIIDLGWVGENGPALPLVQAADVTLIVTRPEIAEVQALLFQVRQMQEAGATVGLVTVGTSPNDPQEVAAVAGVPLVAVLPDDPKVAAALRGAKFAPNKFRRSLLWRTIGGIAASLVDHNVLLARAADNTAADYESLSTEMLAAVPAPAAYADLAPEELLDAAPPLEAAPIEIAAHKPATQPVAPSFEIQPSAVPPRPASFADRHGTPNDSLLLADSDTGPGIAERVAESRPMLAETAGFDHDLFDDTKRIVATAAAEIVLSTGERRALHLDTPTVIGRNAGADIVIPDNQVSRQHGRLSRTATGWHYADLGSRNGSVLNGRPCTDAYLSTGDELYVGTARLVFQLTSTHNEPVRVGSVEANRETECA